MNKDYQENFQYSDFYGKGNFEGIDVRSDSQKILEARFNCEEKTDFCLRHQHSYKGKSCDQCNH